MDASFENAFVTDIGPAKAYATVYVTSDHPAGTVATDSGTTTTPATSETGNQVDPLLLLGFFIAGILILNF